MQRLTSFKIYAPLLSLIILTLLAAFLRFYKLGEWSFWGDEVFTLGTQPDGFVTSLTTRLVHATTAYLGVNEWTARLAPALVGVVTIPVLYFFVARLFGNNVALISSALLAISTWHIYWSQNARFYVLLLLFYSLALFSFYLALEENRPWLLLLSLVFLGLAAQERVLALVFLPVVICYLLGLYILPIQKPAGLNLKNLLIFFSPAVVVALAVAGPFLGNLSGWMTGFGRINNNPVWLFSGFIFYVGIPVIFMAGFGALYLLARRDRAGLFFGLAAVIPLSANLVISTFQYTANRYFFVSLTSWILLASVAANELLRQNQGQSRILAVGVLVLLLGASLSEDYMYYRYQNGNRDNWRSAFDFIKEKGNPDDLVFASDPDLGSYYLGRRSLSLGDFEESGAIEPSRRAWFVIDMTAKELFPGQLAWVEAHALPVAEFDVSVRGRTFTMRLYLYTPSRELNRNIPENYSAFTQSFWMQRYPANKLLGTDG